MGADKIPIAFEYEGKNYMGEFGRVSGSGSTASFHLTVNNFFQGQLINTENYGWKFWSNSGKFQGLSEYFGEYLMAWYQ